MSTTRQQYQKYLVSQDPILMGFLKNTQVKNPKDKITENEETKEQLQVTDKNRQEILEFAQHALRFNNEALKKLIRGHYHYSDLKKEHAIESKEYKLTEENQISTLENLAKKGNTYALPLLGSYEYVKASLEDNNDRMKFRLARAMTYGRYTSSYPNKVLLSFPFHIDLAARIAFSTERYNCFKYNHLLPTYHSCVFNSAKDDLNKLVESEPEVTTEMILDNDDWDRVKELLTEPNQQTVLKHWRQLKKIQEKTFAETRTALDLLLLSPLIGIVLAYSEHSFRPYPSPPKTEAQGPQNYPTNKELKQPSETKESKRSAPDLRKASGKTTESKTSAPDLKKIPEQTWFDKLASFFQRHEKTIEETHEKFAKKSPFDLKKK